MKVSNILLLAVIAAKNLVPAHAALRNVELQKVDIDEEDDLLLAVKANVEHIKQVEVEDEAGADESGRMLGRKGKGKKKKPKAKNGPWKKDGSSSSDDQPCSVEPTVSKSCMICPCIIAIVTYLAINHKILPTYSYYDYSFSHH